MANVQTTDGIVRNLPDATPPDSRQRIAIDPDAFGAPQARAQERSGQVMQKLGDQSLDAGEHFARVQVDDQFSKGFADANKHLDGFRALEGQARLTARPQVDKAIDQSLKVYRDQLKLPMQQAEFDRKVAGFKNGFLNAQMSQLTEQANKSYKVQVAKAQIDNASNMAAVGATDPLSIATARETASHGFANMLEAEGNAGDQTLYDNAIASANRLIDKNVVQALEVTNPKAALEYADKTRESLGHEYTPLANGLRTRLTQQDGFSVANEAMTGAAQELSNPTAQRPSGLYQAITDQEGGPATNPTQIQQSTWDQWQKAGLVHEGEAFGDPAAMEAVSKRAVSKYEQEFKDDQGNPDPARVAVAWFSGPGNVAPAGSPTPYVENRSDLNGKTVDSYVNDIQGRIGGPKGQMYAAKASVYDKVLAATEGKPLVRQAALREVNQRFTAASTAALQTAAAQKAQVDAQLRSYGDFVRKGGQGQPWQQDKSLSEAQVRDMDDYQEKKFKPEMMGSAANPGKGFSQTYQGVLSGSIVNEQQLLPLQRAGDLTPWGYDYLSARLKKLNEPGQETAKLRQSEAFTSAKRQVTMDQFGGPVSTKGLKKWDDAMVAGTAAIDQGREKGMTDVEIFDKENKKGFWAAVKPFMPTLNEQTDAMINGDLDAAKKAATPAFDASKVKTYEELKDAYAHDLVGKEQARQITIERGWKKNTGGAPDVPVSGP